MKGIKAFEACWEALKKSYPTSKADNTLLVQSMGRFVDKYATRTEIRDSLPKPLQTLFERLVDAYLNGYQPQDIQPERSQPTITFAVGGQAMLTPLNLSSETSMSAVSFAPSLTNPALVPPGNDLTEPRITAATLAAAERRQQPMTFSRSEANTLIIDAPLYAVEGAVES